MKDYSNILLSSKKYRSQRDFWIGYLKDLEIEEPMIPNMNSLIKGDKPDEFEKTEFTFDKDLVEKFLKLSKNSDITLYIVFLSALCIFLYKYTQKYKIHLGIPVYSELENEAFFNDFIAFRIDLNEHLTFRELLINVRKYFILIVSNQDYPFQKIIEELNHITNSRFELLLGLIFISEDIHRKRLLDIHKSSFIISYKKEKKDNCIRFKFQYLKSLYLNEDVEQMVKYFILVLGQVVENVHYKLCEIDILSEEEKQRLIIEFNNTNNNIIKNKLIHHLFEEQVVQSPDKIAIISENNQNFWTYKEMNNKANQLAWRLKEYGVKNNSIICVIDDRSFNLVVGIYSILKAGGTYIPIDPEYSSRINFILKDSQPHIILTNIHLKQQISFDKDFVFSDELIQASESTEKENPNVNDDANSLAYIIYTSGTTGHPKGVGIRHRNAVNYIAWAAKVYLNNERLNFPFYTSISFDFTVTTLFVPLITGNSIVIYPADKKEFLIERIIEDPIVGVLKLTPAQINLMRMNNIQGRASSVKKFILGGEDLPLSLAEYLHCNFSEDIEIFNEYGPTEATVGCMTYKFNPDKIYRNSIPIGVPTENVQIYILNEELQPIPIGVIGELYISGEGLARGYLNNPEATAKKILSNPFRNGQFLYKTGDLARFLSDGNIGFLGRIDDQVNLRGFRIELGEIKSQLLKHKEINDAIVVLKEFKENEKVLCAYFISEVKIEPSELKNYLSGKLPDYMIPGFFIPVEEIPLNANGKINKKFLPEPIIESRTPYAAPRNEVETKLTELWQQIFDIKRVGINDNFFEMGGDSIKAIQLSSRLKQHRLELKVSDLFKYPTISQVINFVKRSDRIIYQGIVKGEVRLTPIQKWFFQKKFHNHHHFNNAIVLFKKNGFNVDFIEKVFTKILEHHDALRIVFEIKDNQIIQMNKGIDNNLFSIDIFDLTRKDDIESIVLKESFIIQAGIDLKKGPLVKLGLFRMDEGDHLMIVIHHLVIDGVSWRILLEDFETGYMQMETSSANEFPGKTDSFQTWAEKLVEFSQTNELLMELDYWKNIEETRLQNLPKDFDDVHALRKNKYNDSISFEFSGEITGKLLKDVNRPYTTEINDILMTALGLAIKEWAGIGKILINLEGHGREEVIEGVDISRTICWCTAMFPVILDMEKSEDISYLIKATKENLRKIPKKGIGYGILKYLTPKQCKRNIDFVLEPEINFNYFGQFGFEEKEDKSISGNRLFRMSDLKISDSISPEAERMFAIDINGMVINSKLRFTLDYNLKEYRKESIKKLIGYFKSQLIFIVDHCMQKKDVELTPSDVADTEEELAIDELNEIQEMIDS